MYQDVLDADGLLIESGDRDCVTRWAAIAGVLDGMSGFTALDLGAHQGYFAQRLAQTFDADVTAVEDTTNILSCPDVRIVNQWVTAADVVALGSFDVVLLMSILHHMADWRDVLDHVLATSQVVFIEYPDRRESLVPMPVSHGDELVDHLDGIGGELIARTPGFDARFLRPLIVVEV